MKKPQTINNKQQENITIYNKMIYNRQETINNKQQTIINTL